MSVFVELLKTAKTSFIPALILLAASLCCAVFQVISPHDMATLNCVFYAVFIINFILLFRSNENRQLYLLVITAVFYIVFNRLRFNAPMNETLFFLRSATCLAPLNLCLIFFKKNFSKTDCLYALIFGLAQAALIENAALENLFLFSWYFVFLAYVLWIVLLVFLLIKASFFPFFKQAGVFFAMLSFCLALFNALNAEPFVIYSLATVCIVLYANAHALINAYYKDETTGVYSQNSFINHDIKKFPPKYSMAFFEIDNYAKLLKVFGTTDTDRLTEMIVEKVRSNQPEALIYRNLPNEFTLVFFAFDIKQTYEAMEDIRRQIAGTEFVFKKNKSVKLTITPVVSEKRRSDADALAVLKRMHENFHQKYRFTQNITFCEEIESAKKIRRTPSKF